MVRQMTSNSLQKLCTKLMDDKRIILDEMHRGDTFTASINEDVEALKKENALDLGDKLIKLDKLNRNIKAIKHAKNVFNSSHVLDTCKMTIDEALVRLAMLQELKGTLDRMANRKTKERNFRTTSKDPEYVYTTYDIKLAKHKYNEVFAEIQTIQEALNDANATVMVHVDLDEDI